MLRMWVLTVFTETESSRSISGRDRLVGRYRSTRRCGHCQVGGSLVQASLGKIAGCARERQIRALSNGTWGEGPQQRLDGLSLSVKRQARSLSREGAVPMTSALAPDPLAWGIPCSCSRPRAPGVRTIKTFGAPGPVARITRIR